MPQKRPGTRPSGAKRFSSTLSSTIAALQHFTAGRHDFFWPGTHDPREHGANLILGQDLSIGRHIALITLWRMRRHHAVAHDRDQQLIFMMPGVPTRIMGRCRQAAVRAARAPIRLPLEPLAVTSGTVRGIDFLTD